MASYIHPFRLYLTTSVIFFLLFSFLSLRLVRQATLGGEDDAPAAADSAVVASDSASIAADSARLAELDSALAVIETQLADASLPGGVAAALRMARNETRSSRREILARLQATEAAEGAPAPASPAPASPGEGGAGGVLEGGAAESGAATDSAGAGSETVAAGESPGSPQTVNELFGWDDEASNVDVNLGFAAADSALIQQVRRIGRMEPKQALEELVRTFLNYVPTMMFILLPIFAVVLKLLYIRRGRFYAEHFVFLLHVHAFVYLLSTAMLLLRSYVTGWLEALLFVWVLVYIYLAMRRVYGQGWFKTFVKYWILGWTYFWILTASIPIAAIAAVLLF